MHTPDPDNFLPGRTASQNPARNGSPLLQVADILLRLRLLFSGLTTGRPENFQERTRKICLDLQSACAADADAAMGVLLLDRENRYSITHPLHVAILCELAAADMAMDAESRISVIAASLTSNIAMIELQDTLQKQQSPLTDAQIKSIRQHPVRAAEILTNAGVQDPLWLEAVRHHHEKPDGSGYPDGLRGDAVSLPVRIMALADIYSAMISPRQYRMAKFSGVALRSTFLQRSSEIGMDLSSLFFDRMGMFPPGSFVTLKNNETAIVVKRGLDGREPLVKSILSPRGEPLAAPALRDSNQENFAISDIVPPSKGLSIRPDQLWVYPGY